MTYTELITMRDKLQKEVDALNKKIDQIHNSQSHGSEIRLNIQKANKREKVNKFTF